MSTRYNCLGEAVLTPTHNLCFEQKYEEYQNFYLKIFIFLVVFFFFFFFLVYLNIGMSS